MSFLSRALALTSLLLFATPLASLSAQEVRGPREPREPEDASLYHLSAGTVLTFKRAILIPANAYEQRITPPGAPLQCTIRMNKSRPFNRVIREGKRFTVTGTDRSALSARSFISSSTRVHLMSDAIDDILCSGKNPVGDPKIREFRQALGGAIQVETPNHAVDVS